MNRDKAVQAVLECLETHYGFGGELERLPGENLNYLLKTPDGRRYVAKVVDDDMPSEVVLLAEKAIAHVLAKNIDVELPEVLENRYGNYETRIEIPGDRYNRLHLMRFLKGFSLQNITDISADLLKNTGEMLARVDRALSDFDDPAAHRDHRWNLAGAGRHREKIGLVADRERRDSLAWAFDIWSEKAAPRLRELPWQVIHGDPFAENILVRGGKVTGLVDFGDCCYNPAVCDLAICLAYLMMEKEDPLAVAESVTAGYQAMRPLSPAEREVLLPLVGGRLAVTVTVAEQRRRIDPDNPTWFGSEQAALALIERLRESHRS